MEKKPEGGDCLDNPVFAILEPLVLVTALSVDAFVASFAYGTNQIKIPFRSVAVISGICSSGASVHAGASGRGALFFHPVSARHRQTVRQRHQIVDPPLTGNPQKDFLLGHASALYPGCVRQPRERGQRLFQKPFSLDGLAVGFGAALSEAAPLRAVLFSLVANVIAVCAGCLTGNKVAEKIPLDLSWVSGLLLMVLAFLKLT